MSDKNSGKIHPIPSTIANQRWISIRNIIIYLETKFRPNRRSFVFGSHLIPWLPWQRPPFWIFSTSQKLPHNTVDIPTKWIIIWLPNHGYQFPTSKSTWKSNFAQNRRIFVFWRSSWIQKGRHSKPTMAINSQHHNLLGNQISPKSEDFYNWRPFCTLVTMATAAISNCFQPPKSCHILRWIFLHSFMKFDERNPIFLNPPFLFLWQLQQSLSNRFRFYWPISFH